MTICLTGMHRSGTSLMASYLEKCNINMGDDKVGAMRGNLRGHFEDTEFVDLHDSILRDNRCHMYNPADNLSILPVRKKRAEEIIEKRKSKYQHFGWKDPRTTLFLDFWADMLPDCKFVLLYRDPFTVIDSLRRRRSDRRILIMTWLPVIAWLTYNQRILDFYTKNPERSIIMNIAGFNKSHKCSSKLLADFLQHDLDTPYTDVYHEKEINKSPSRSLNPFFQATDALFRNRLLRMYTKLENIATVDSNGL